MTSVPGSNVWTARAISLPPGTADGALFGVTCNSSTCYAAGTYSDGAIGHPLILNGGLVGTWTSEALSEPPSISSGELRTASCSDTLCTAAGLYNDGVNAFYLMYVKTGASWILTSFTTFADFNGVFGGSRGGIQASNCVLGTCILTGAYISQTNERTPIIFSGTGAVFTKVTETPSDFQELGNIVGTSSINNNNMITLGGA